MQFNCPHVTRGNRLHFKNMSITGATNTTTCTTALGAEYQISDSVNFQIRAVCYDQKVCSSGTLLKAVQISVKLQSRDENFHSVVVSSEFLKLHRYIQVEPASQAVETWHVIYNKMVDLATWLFDLDVMYMKDGVNEPVAAQLMLSLYQDAETTDVKLIGVDGAVGAHGHILAAVSPFFRAAFYGQFPEAREKGLNVPDANVSALKLIKKYAYTGFVDAEPAMLVMLLPLASRFLMTSLARACAASLSELAPDDLIPLLQIDLKPTREEPDEKKPPLLMIEMLSRIDNKLEAMKINPDTEDWVKDQVKL